MADWVEKPALTPDCCGERSWCSRIKVSCLATKRSSSLEITDRLEIGWQVEGVRGYDWEPQFLKNGREKGILQVRMKGTTVKRKIKQIGKNDRIRSAIRRIIPVMWHWIQLVQDSWCCTQSQKQTMTEKQSIICTELMICKLFTYDCTERSGVYKMNSWDPITDPRETP
jgi:hypothetical protein